MKDGSGWDLSSPARQLSHVACLKVNVPSASRINVWGIVEASKAILRPGFGISRHTPDSVVVAELVSYSTKKLSKALPLAPVISTWNPLTAFLGRSVKFW